MVTPVTTVSPVPDGVLAARGADPGCVIVIGTGGVGGSTVAASLAVAAASGGADVLLVGIDDTDGLGPLVGGSEIDDRERELCRIAGGGRVRGRTISLDRAFSEMFQFKGVGGFLRRAATSASVPLITAATPGLDALLRLGTIEELERRRAADMIVVDCPPAPSGTSLLRAPVHLSGVIHAEAATERAARVEELYRDPQRARALVVCSPDDEASVDTAIGVADDLAAIGLALLPVVANRCSPSRPGLDEPVATDAEAVAADLSAQGADVLASATLVARPLLERQRDGIERLEARWAAPVVRLPRLPSTRLEPDDVRTLAAALRDGLR